MWDLQGVVSGLLDGWQVKLVCAVLIVAAVIDGWKLRVPNWITYPLVLAGWGYWAFASGWSGVGFSLMGTAVGLALLLPAYAVGGMGAGDVKLLAGVGAWTGTHVVFWSFCLSAIVGAVLALAMVLYRRTLQKHYQQFKMLLLEFWIVRSPSALAAVAGQRKSNMLLLPYGIPLAIGSIGYFLWAGML